MQDYWSKRSLCFKWQCLFQAAVHS